jgi:hypothetical protein
MPKNPLHAITFHLRNYIDHKREAHPAELAGNPRLLFQIQPTEDRIAQAGQDAWGLASAYSRVVFPPVHITDPVDLVLNGPMQANGLQQGCRWEFCRAATAHPHDGFLSDFARFENRRRAF